MPDDLMLLARGLLTVYIVIAAGFLLLGLLADLLMPGEFQHHGKTVSTMEKILLHTLLAVFWIFFLPKLIKGMAESR